MIADTKKQAQKKIKELVKQLNDWANRYYVEDQPIVEDYVYDKAYRELIELEREYPTFILEDSHTQRVGGQVLSGFEKKENELPMLSFGDVF